MPSANAVGAASTLFSPPRPDKPEKCRKQTRKRLKALKGPKARDGFILHPDAIERRWIETRCAACQACALF